MISPIISSISIGFLSSSLSSLNFFNNTSLPSHFNPTKQEVMWPWLVANKILRKRLGSSNFVADYPSYSENLLETSSAFDSPIPLSPTNIFNQHKTIHKYKCFVSTWNVGGVEPDEDLSMEDWIDPSCDIYVLGFQEMVPLKASNVLGTEKTKISNKWNRLIREVLNKKKQYGLNKSSISEDFQCVISKQMVGIQISVWVRSSIRPFIRNPSVSCIGCGIMACLGNKGSVSVRLQIHETSFCFVCSHLASGGREGDEKYRNSNVSEILSRTSFPRGPLLDLPQKILDHDRVIWLGDLNYRISLPEAKTRLLVDRGEWITLLENDQLRRQLMDGQLFEDWHEGAIKFAPTYKYCPNSDLYFGGLHGNKSEKKRAPAWCDRIIWHGEGLKQHLYTRGESKLSDHRPVKAIFTVEVCVLQRLKGFESLFLSERFEHITNKFEVPSTEDHFLCGGKSSF